MTQRDRSTRSVTQQRSFGPSLEWEGLPILGEDNNHAFRARVWRVILLGLAIFWGAVFTVISIL